MSRQRSFARQFGVPVQRVQSIIRAGDVEQADAYLGLAARKAVTEIDGELPEIIARQWRHGFRIALRHPISVRPGEESAGMIEQRKKVGLMQRRFIFKNRIGKMIGAIIEIGVAQAITRADRPFVSQQLVDIHDQTFFVIIEMLAQIHRVRRGWSKPRRESAENRAETRIEQLAFDTEISSAPEPVIETEAVGFKNGTRDRAGNRFGNERAIGLIESGDLRRLESEALIDTSAAQRSGVTGAHPGVLQRRPDQAGLGRDALATFFARVDGWVTKILRIIDPVVAQAGAHEQRRGKAPVVVAIKTDPLETSGKILLSNLSHRKKKRRHGWIVLVRSGFELTVLITDAGDDGVFFRLENFLQLGGVDFQFAVVGFVRLQHGQRRVISARDRSQQILPLRTVHRRNIGQPPGEENGVQTGRPFVMIAEQDLRFLPLPGSKILNGAALIVILGGVAGVDGVVDNLQVSAVLWRQLLFELRGQINLLLLVVGALSIFTAIVRIQRKAAAAEVPENRAGLNPIAAAVIMCFRREAEAVTFEEPGIVLRRQR